MSKKRLFWLLAGLAIFSLIAACGGGGGGAVPPAAPAETIPAAPSGLTATPDSDTQITLDWTDNATDETGFNIYNSTDDVIYTLLANVGADEISYVVTGLVASTKYYYQVRAENGAGESSADIANATTHAPPVTIPNAPINLQLTVDSETQITLDWTDNSTDESFFSIYNSGDGVTYAFFANVTAGTTTYPDSGLSGSTTYYYEVRAKNSAGESAASGANATTAPVAPSALTATTASDSQITLDWTDNSPDETGFNIYNSGDGVTYSLLATVGAGVTTYSDAGLSEATAYYYKVMAESASGESAGVSASATTRPTAPTGLVGESTASGQYTLTWTDNSGVEDEYRVYKGTNVTGQCTGQAWLATVAANATTYDYTGAGGDLCFEVVAVINGAPALKSATDTIFQVLATTAPADMGALTIGFNWTTLQLTVSWADVLGEEGYLVEYISGYCNNSAFHAVTVPADSTSHVTQYSAAYPPGSGTASSRRVTPFNQAGSGASTCITKQF